MQSWLWPDRVIGKRESRVLRDEHNRVINLNAELLAALGSAEQEIVELLEDFCQSEGPESDVQGQRTLQLIRAAIVKATK